MPPNRAAMPWSLARPNSVMQRSGCMTSRFLPQTSWREAVSAVNHTRIELPDGPVLRPHCSRLDVSRCGKQVRKPVTAAHPLITRKLCRRWLHGRGEDAREFPYMARCAIWHDCWPGPQRMMGVAPREAGERRDARKRRIVQAQKAGGDPTDCNQIVPRIA
jgi:hypothetical protein